MKYTIEEYLKAYEEEMTIFQDNWIESPQLKELFAMANDKIINDKSLEYQKLENPTTRDKEKNDFLRAKKSKEFLQRYSKMGNVNQDDLKSFVDKSEIEEERKVREDEKKRLELLEKERIEKDIIKEKKKEEDRKQKKKEDDKWDAIHKPSNSKYLKDSLRKFIEDYPNSSKVPEANKELERLNSKNEKVNNKNNSADSIFANAKNIGELNSIVNSNKSTDENVQALGEAILGIYKDIKEKKQVKFIKDLKKKKKLIEWLGEDKIDKLISSSK